MVISQNEQKDGWGEELSKGGIKEGVVLLKV